MYSHGPEEPCNKVVLLSSLRVVDNLQKPFMFSLLNADGTVYVHLQCVSEPEKIEWWAALQKAIKMPSSSTSTESSGGVAITPSSSPPGGGSSSDSKVRKEDFQKLALVGRGSCAKVLKVRHRQTGNVYAMKVMFKEHVVLQNMASAVMAESEILRRLSHPFVIKLHFAFQTNDKLYLIEEFHCGGALTYHLNECGWFTEPCAQFYGAELFLALQYLHTMNIIYRDFKPGNIIFDKDGHIIITDFGLATVRDQATTFCGTPHCMAPEVVQHHPYTKAVDWWSYGAVLYHMMIGCPPFSGECRQVAYERIVHSPLIFARDVSRAAQQLLQGCLDKNPAKRFSGPHVRASAFFSSIDWKAVEERRLVPPIIPNIKGDDLRYFPSSIKKFLNESDSIDDRNHQENGASNFEGFSFYRKPG
jgi:serine/threonine protein kinase